MSVRQSHPCGKTWWCLWSKEFTIVDASPSRNSCTVKSRTCCFHLVHALFLTPGVSVSNPAFFSNQQKFPLIGDEEVVDGRFVNLPAATLTLSRSLPLCDVAPDYLSAYIWRSIHHHPRTLPARASLDSKKSKRQMSITYIYIYMWRGPLCIE